MYLVDGLDSSARSNNELLTELNSLLSHKCHKETNCSFKAFPFRISKILFFFPAKQLVTWEGDKIILLNEMLLCFHYVNFSTNSCISTVNRSLKAKKKRTASQSVTYILS